MLEPKFLEKPKMQAVLFIIKSMHSLYFAFSYIKYSAISLKIFHF